MAKSAPKAPSYRERLGYAPYEDPGIDCSKDEPIVQQSFADECDINRIVARHGGIPAPTLERTQALYGDFSEVPDLAGAINLANAAQEAFMELPAEARKEFDNDPVNMLAFMEAAKTNPALQEKAVQMGLAKAKPVPTPQGGITSPPAPSSAPQPGPSAPAGASPSAGA